MAAVTSCFWPFCVTIAFKNSEIKNLFYFIFFATIQVFCQAIFTQKINIQDSCREEKSQALKENLVFLTHFDCLDVLPFQKRMHQIMTTCFHSVRQKLHRRSGTFDLLGFDFLIDEDFKVRYANHEKSKGPCKRWPTRHNIVGPNMLRAFAHHVVCCCDLLEVVG